MVLVPWRFLLLGLHVLCSSAMFVSACGCSGGSFTGALSRGDYLEEPLFVPRFSVNFGEDDRVKQCMEMDAVAASISDNNWSTKNAYVDLVAELIAKARNFDGKPVFGSPSSVSVTCAVDVSLRHVLQLAYEGGYGVTEGLSSVPDFVKALEKLGNPVQILIQIAKADLDDSLHSAPEVALLTQMFSQVLASFSSSEQALWNSIMSQSFTSFGASGSVSEQSFPTLFAPGH